MSESLNGIYSANDGGFYYVRFVPGPGGGNLFWYGEKSDGAFSNVMRGKLRAVAGSSDLSIEDAPWWDVPKARRRGASDPARENTLLDLDIEGTRIGKVSSSGIEFGGATWTKIAARPARMPVVLESAAGAGLTGIWSGNDGGVYYVRQRGAEVAWFGEQCTAPESMPAFANVFVGSIAGTRIKGSWADVPYGGSSGFGTLELNVSGSVLRRVTGTGFGGSEWKRVSIGGSTIIGSLIVSMTCGGDDLRGGSVIYGSVELTDGRVVGRTPLSNGNYVNPGETLSKEIVLAPTFAVHRSDLAALVLEWDGAPRRVGDTYDNWNVDRIVVGYKPAGSTCSSLLASPTGSPVVRFKGDNTLFKVPLRP